MTYKLTHSTSIIDISRNAAIPADPDNTDYQEYLRWLEEGNEPLPPDPIPEPEPLTPQQKLEQAGLSIEELKELLGL
ncbi:hypothetical protein PQC13_gp003 [Synechococcus phage S-SRM01]|uniref:Uncharacterized protein n=1 Tax=Synechococcus phage S-SRM01 TaxID=2781608 RepID=A0A879R3B1_9CAUD|nr:hypothetical protein PQC13_gp003 [Synechococcus phage S-SRM01]QPX47968.1 hypothetical protein [Synechococcus phage S-SRM01]